MKKCCVQRSWLIVCSGVYFIVNCLPSRALFYGVLLNQNQSNHNPSGKKKMSFRAKEIQSKIDQFCQSAGKQATKSWLVLVLHLNNWESGANFLGQSQNEFMRKQSNPGFLSTLNSKLSHDMIQLCQTTANFKSWSFERKRFVIKQKQSNHDSQSYQRFTSSLAN